MLYQFFGVITPERAQLSIKSPKIGLKLYKENNTFLNYTIILNQIYVEYDTPIEEEDIYTLRNNLCTIISDNLSIISYLKGIFYEIDLRRMINRELSLDEVFGVNIPYVDNRRTDISSDEKIFEKFKEIYHAIDKLGQFQNYIRLCLSNLSLSMKLHLDTPFFCYRAIEALRNYCGKKYNKSLEMEQWKKLSLITNFDKSKMDYLRSHGHIISFSDEERQRFFEDTLDIIDAFFENELKVKLK
jgi:hypothetical protein